jgi:hypothetical protein
MEIIQEEAKMLKIKDAELDGLSPAAQLIYELIRAKNGKVVGLNYIHNQCKESGFSDLEIGLGLADLTKEDLIKPAEIIPQNSGDGKVSGLILNNESGR